MLDSFRVSSLVSAQMRAAIGDLLHTTSRRLIYLIVGLCLLGQFLSMAALPESISREIDIMALIALPVGVLALLLHARWPSLAQAVWQVGLAIVIAYGARAFREPAMAHALSILPLLAVVSAGWQAGLLSSLGVTGLTLWLARQPAMPALTPGAVWAIAGGGFCSALLAWYSTRAYQSTTHWTLYYFEQMRVEMDGFRDQRLEMGRIQEDLVQANNELARLSDRLRAMRQVADEARQAKEEFAANVSHELRTPLNMIIGFSEMIAQSPEVYGEALPASLLADIDAIQRNSQQLARLVNDVLDLSQIDAGRMALSKEWCSLDEILTEATLAVRALFESKGLFLEVDVADDLPALFVDNTRIREVVLNLVSNAGRFTERGGVRVRAWQEARRVVVSVADTGPGISPDDHNRLFEPFQQLDASIRRRHGGTGLGLSISKRFVEMHGGRMWLESELGRGTTFFFSLPVDWPGEIGGDRVMRWFNPDVRMDDRLRTRAFQAPAPEVRPRLVVLESGETLQRLIKRYWDEVEVAAAESVEAAIDALSQSPAQALIVNASPFGPAPIDSSQLLDLPYDTPAVTCWVPGEDDAARRLGVIRYLVKPIPRATLIDALEDLDSDVRTILVVDDDPGALQLFVRMLSTTPHDYRILQASSGQRALELLQERQPDVMLLDLIMPGMSGFEVLKQKSAQPAIRDIPVLVISSRDPLNEPIVSNALTLMRGRGLSVSTLLACIRALSSILAPLSQAAGPAPPERPAA